MRGLACVAALCVCGADAPLAQARPERVVSVNLCTDQLALMLAAPGQLVSVSRLAHDADSSVMVDKSRALPANGSGAEEVYLLDPDLVLASTFTSPATVNLLRDLGIPVEQFAPAQSLADIPERLRQMGRALGREAEADGLIASFEADLARLADGTSGERPRAALTYVNSFSSGSATLAGDILRVAGFDNVATEIGLSGSGKLPLEDLILLAPDVIIQGRDYPGVARAEDNLTHPALRALKATRVDRNITDRGWICGTPHVLDAVAALRSLRLEQGAAR